MSSDTTVVGIHQPNFFPWLGYFQKIHKSDVFVFLDAVEFTKGSWINRVKLLVSGEKKWVTCPVSVDSSDELICDVTIADDQRWRDDMVKMLKFDYAGCPFFEEEFDWLKDLIHTPVSNLAEYNVRTIISMADRIGLESTFQRHSEMDEEEVFSNSGSERLASITKLMGGDCYLAGDGAEEYEDLSVYEESNITFRKLGFAHPRYEQKQNDDFVKGLSVIDALMNVGRDGIKKSLLKE